MRTLWVQAYDPSGRLVHDLQGSGDAFHFVTGMREDRGKLYLGSLVEHAVAAIDLPS